MKKMLMILISLALVLTMAGGVSAADVKIDDLDSGEVNSENSITVTLPADLITEGIIISFPSDITLAGTVEEGITGKDTISVIKAVYPTLITIETSRYSVTGLQITVNSDNEWHLGGSDGFPYELTVDGNVIEQDGTVLTHQTQDDYPSKELNFKLGTVTLKPASDLTDTLTFTVSYLKTKIPDNM